MKRISLVFLLVLTISGTAFAQVESRVNSGIDVGLGYQDKKWAPSGMYHQELSLAHFSWFRLGWGIRTYGYYAGRTDLAPKSTSSGGDSLKFGKVSTNGISFLVGASVRLWRFDIGANTDLVGVAFGVQRRGLYSKATITQGAGSEFYNMYVPSSPTSLNAIPLLFSNGNGQSELFVRFWITERVGLKVGYVHGKVTYTASEKLDNGQTRFSTTYGVPYAALAFPLYN